jgi:hypothetical protein
MRIPRFNSDADPDPPSQNDANPDTDAYNHCFIKEIFVKIFNLKMSIYERVSIIIVYLGAVSDVNI